MGIGKTCAVILWAIGFGENCTATSINIFEWSLWYSLNEVICQCYSWYRRGKNFTKLCNEYNIVGSSPLIFDVRKSSEQFVKADHLFVLDIALSICLSVFYFMFFISTWVVNKRTCIYNYSSKVYEWLSICRGVPKILGKPQQQNYSKFACGNRIEGFNFKIRFFAVSALCTSGLANADD